MVEGYELVEYKDPKGRPFWELTTSPDNSQFQKMLTDPKKKLAARKMIDQISKIYDYGLKVGSAQRCGVRGGECPASALS